MGCRRCVDWRRAVCRSSTRGGQGRVLGWVRAELRRRSARVDVIDDGPVAAIAGRRHPDPATERQSRLGVGGERNAPRRLDLCPRVELSRPRGVAGIASMGRPGVRRRRHGSRRHADRAAPADSGLAPGRRSGPVVSMDPQGCRDPGPDAADRRGARLAVAGGRDPHWERTGHNALLCRRRRAQRGDWLRVRARRAGARGSVGEVASRARASCASS